jgi:vacuolar-type H+-ATPase subunit E/Vma4
MALSDILQKIKDEAGKKAAFMKQVADDEIAKIKAEASERAKAKRAEITARAEEKSAKLQSKAKLLAKMEARNLLLTEKRQVIEDVYAESVKELEHLKGHDLEKLMVSMFKAASKTMPKAHVIVSAGHKRQAEEAIEKARVDYRVKDESSELKGGMILADGKQEMNLSFSYVLGQIVRPKTELDIAKILFE